jgi:hypothetical protein
MNPHADRASNQKAGQGSWMHSRPALPDPCEPKAGDQDRLAGFSNAARM